MSEKIIYEEVADYNNEFENAFSYYSIIGNEEPNNYEKIRYYKANSLTPERIKTLVCVIEEKKQVNDNSWYSNVLNGYYYNIFDNSSTEYEIVIGTGIRKKTININILPNGMIEYNELSKLKPILGNVPIEGLGIEELYCLLLKLQLTNIPTINFIQLKKAIDLKNLNSKLNDFIREYCNPKVKCIKPIAQ
ncbi:MAG: hypothetical protein NC181_01200 [Clostridium sp.]|nr:hypothetical protein [Clostridium sp.]MCM1444006.1 hypothetical protein [Candidatus Amulumruptor caecigallinarius]